MQEDTSDYVPGEKALKILQLVEELKNRAYGYVIYLKLSQNYPTIQLIDVYEIIVDLVSEEYLFSTTEGKGDGHRKLYKVNPDKANG